MREELSVLSASFHSAHFFLAHPRNAQVDKSFIKVLLEAACRHFHIIHFPPFQKSFCSCGALDRTDFGLGILRAVYAKVMAEICIFVYNPDGKAYHSCRG